MKKTLFILFIGFILQIILSCDYNCGKGPTYEMEFSSLSFSAQTRASDSGFLEPITDSIRRQDLRLFLVLEEVKKSQLSDLPNISFGFNATYALDCGPYYIYEDLISEIKISMLDPKEAYTSKDVTSLFIKDTGSNTTVLTVEDLIARQTIRTPLKSVSLECIIPDSLYDITSFKLEVYLESGKLFEQETAIVNFIN